MSEHDWTEWPEDEPDFAEADTADLGDGFGDSGFGESGFPDASFDGDGSGDFGDHGPGHEPVEGLGEAAPQPLGYGDALADDQFEAEPDEEPELPEPSDEGTGPQDLAGFGPAEDAPVGADPDVDPTADDTGWQALPFPEPLDLGGAPEPVDGFPWTDAAVLGDGGTPLPDPAAAPTGAPEAGDLFAYAGEDVPAGGADWTALVASPDPATSSLARWWGPGA